MNYRLYAELKGESGENIAELWCSQLFDLITRKK